MNRAARYLFIFATALLSIGVGLWARKHGAAPRPAPEPAIEAPAVQPAEAPAQPISPVP